MKNVRFVKPIRFVIVLSLAFVMALTISAIAFGGGSGSAADAGYGNPGAAAYTTYCAGCHGTNGKDGTVAKSNIAGENADKIIKKSRSGKGNMPAFGTDVVDDATMKALGNYVAGM